MNNFWNNSMFSIALSALVEDPMFKLEWPSVSKKLVVESWENRGISKEGVFLKGGFWWRWRFQIFNNMIWQDMEEGWWNQFLTTCFFQNHQDESQVLKVWVSNAHCPRAAGIHGFFLLWNRPLAILWCIWSASTDFGQTNVTIAPYIALVLDIYTTPTKTDTIMTTPLEWTSVTWFATWDNTVDGFTIPCYWKWFEHQFDFTRSELGGCKHWFSPCSPGPLFQFRRYFLQRGWNHQVFLITITRSTVIFFLKENPVGPFGRNSFGLKFRWKWRLEVNVCPTTSM